MVTADLRDPAAVLADPTVNRLIDFTQPVGLMLVGIMHHLHDDEDPAGSYLFLTCFCRSFAEAAELEKTYLSVLGTGRFRTLEEIGEYFTGLEMVDPGLVYLPQWRPEIPIDHELSVPERLMAGGIARKP